MRKFTRYLSFCCVFAVSILSVNAATFTSVSSGTYSNPLTWSVVGFDANGIPDADDDVTVVATTTVSLTSASSCRSLTTNLGGAVTLSGQALLIYGSFTNNGSTSGTGSLQFRASGTYTSTVHVNINGSVYFIANYTIAAGSSLKSFSITNVSSGVTVNNNGSYQSSGSLNLLGSSVWNNLSGSTLVAAGVASSGSLNASAVPNTVTYVNNFTTIKTGVTYYNLTLAPNPVGVKSINGTLDVLNNLQFNTGMTLNANNNSINVGGNWTNNANTTCQNLGTVDFNGSGTQTISRSTTEIFNSFNTSGTGTVLLARGIRCDGDVKLTGGTLDVSASNFGIEVRGNWTNNATFNARQGTVTFSRTAAPVQQIDGSSDSQFYNLTSSNTGSGVEVVAPNTLTNLLTVTTGLFGTSGAGTLTLDATGPTTYARIGTVGGSLTGTGWIIRSYIDGPAAAYWQYLSSPINGNTLNDWDIDPRFYMSAVGGNDGTACCPTFFSVRTYNEPTNTYTNITTTATALTPGRGFMIWMSDNLTGLTSPLIYDSQGIPSFSTKTFPITAGGSGGGYNLVGNPYACPIDYTSVVTASGNLGGSFLVLSESGSYVTNPNGGVIAPNQGFLCPATSSGVITFTEACKNTTALPNIIRIGDPENFIRINIRSVMNGLGGQAVVNFDPNSTRNNDIGIDLPFIESPYELAANIWTKGADNSELLMNVDPAQEDEITIPLFVEPAVFGQHDLTFEGMNAVNTYSCATLENPSTGEIIDLGKQSKYSFIVNSTGKKTFLLHFKRTPDGCRLADQAMTANLEAQTSVYANANGLFAKFGFSDATDIRLSVFNMLGQEIIADKQATVQNETLLLDVPESHGIYLVRVQVGDKEITKKIFY